MPLAAQDSETPREPSASIGADAPAVEADAPVVKADEEPGEEAAAGRFFGDSLAINVGANFGFKETLFWNGQTVRMDYAAGPLRLVADLAMNNDQKYAPARAMLPSGNFLGYYFFMNEGGLALTLGNFYLEGGRFRLYDIVDSPYTLFINSLGHAGNTVGFKYESPHFIYQSRWIELNSRNSVSSPAWNEYHWRLENGQLPVANNPVPAGSTPANFGFPDRGANYKIYALKVNDWRLGFLDAAIYTGRSFDFEYLLNPIPQYFIQYVKGASGRPWTTNDDENNLIGIFWDINRSDKWEAYAQILIDDFSLGFLRWLYDGFSNNPWKAAWAFGGRLHTPYGRFGFHHALALKYTFEPIGSPEGIHAGNDARTAYGYTWYPETRYFNDESGGSPISILIEDNMLGYKHGENNIAFQADYQNTFSGFLVNAELEFSLTGSSSPANPWQDYTSRSAMYDDGKEGTWLFDDGQLEKRLELRGNVSWRYRAWTFYAAMAIGGLFNKLELAPPHHASMGTDPASGIADTIYIWKASSKNEFIFRVSIGVKYTFDIF
jgi:hypothetical protein